MFVQFALLFDAVAGSYSQRWIEMYNNGGDDLVCRLQIQSDRSIAVRGSDGVIAAQTAPGVIQTGIWQYLEVKVVSAASGEVRIKLDGVEVLNETGIDTSISDTTVTRVRFMSSSSSFQHGMTYDDIVILDDGGVAPHNDNIGDVRIAVLLPTSDEGPNDWVPSGGSNEYEMIDDPVPGGDDGDTTYISGDTPAQKSLFGFGGLPGDAESIFAVASVVSARKTDAGSKTMRTYVDSGGTIDNGDTWGVVTDYFVRRHIWERDPNTGALFVKAGVDAIKSGVEVVS